MKDYEKRKSRGLVSVTRNLYDSKGNPIENTAQDGQVFVSCTIFDSFGDSKEETQQVAIAALKENRKKAAAQLAELEKNLKDLDSFIVDAEKVNGEGIGATDQG